MKTRPYTIVNKLIINFSVVCLLVITNTIAKGQNLRLLDKNNDQAIVKAKLSQDEGKEACSNAQGIVDITVFDLSYPIRIEHKDYGNSYISREDIYAANFCIQLSQQKTKEQQYKPQKIKKANSDSNPQRLNLQEVVISANRWEQDRSEVPNKISTIQAKDIAFTNPQTTADLLSYNDEVFIQKSQMGGGSPILRGFATNRILIVVDGVRMNNAIFRSGNLQNVISLDPNSIQNSEVIFGPGSVMYGSDAIGGVMDFHTLQPKFSDNSKALITGNAMGRWSSANAEKTEHFDVNISNKKWSSLSSFTFSHYGDLKMGKNGGHEEYTRPEYVEIINGQDSIFKNDNVNIQKHSRYHQLNVLQKITFKATEKLHFDYAFHYSRLSDVPRYDRLIQYKNNKLKYAEWYYGPQKWMMHSLKTTLWSKTKLFDQAKLILAYQNYEESRHDRKLNKSKIRERKEQLDIYTVNLDLNKFIGSKSELFYGAEYNFNHIASSGFTRNIHNKKKENIASRYPNGSIYTAASVYANYKFRASDKWTFLAGARYNYTNVESDFDTKYYPFPFNSIQLNNNAFNTSIGTVFSPQKDWEFHANVSSGFRAPNVDDVSKVFDSEPGHVVVPNPELKPEYAYNAELSIVKTIGYTARISCTGFYTLLKDAMIRSRFKFNGQDSIVYDGEMSQVQALVNADEATIYGIQAGFTSRLYRNLSIRANINYTKGFNKDDDPMRHVPPMFGSAHLIYDNHIKIDIFANYNGEIAYEDLALSERNKPHIFASDNDGNPYCPAWFTLNALASVPINKEWQINAGVHNILDTRYRPYSSGIVAPGRHISISLRGQF